MKSLSLIILTWLLCHTHASADDRRIMLLKMGTTGNQLSSEWKEALRSRMSPGRLDSFARLKRELSPEEIAWKELIAPKIKTWNSYRDSLAVPFRDIVLPDTVYIMLGCFGDDDGFTFKDRTVCLDITALSRAYGDARLIENNNRIDRIFAHEFTHLLHKSWAAREGYKTVTFKDEVLWECLYEGIGMYRSLNARWLPAGDTLPSVTQAALSELYPSFTEWMMMVQKNPSLTAPGKAKVQANLSRGPVNKKWGAFPVAIWLVLEAKGNDKNLVQWIDKGPEAVIALAKKYLPAELNKRFTDAFQ